MKWLWASWTASDGGVGCGVSGMCVCGGDRGGRGWWQWILLIFNLIFYICSHDFLHILSNLSQKFENAVTISAVRIFLKNFAE